MKKILSITLAMVMVISLSIPAFASKPFAEGDTIDKGVEVVSSAKTNGKSDKFNNKVEKELPKGLQDKEVIPYGHRKDVTVEEEEMEALIEEVLEYIDNLDVDSDDDAIEDSVEELEIIDLEEAEEIALDEKDGAIVKMSFDKDKYKFEIWFEDELFEVEVNALTKDVEVETEDDEYDLEDIISYEDAKEIALDEANGTIIKVKLDIEEADDDEDKEATYEVNIIVDDMIYEIEIDALTGEVIDVDTEENDDDWNRDRDRDQYRDGDMIPAILNLIDRIEYELEKDEPVLEHYMFQLEKKFNVLQKNFGKKEVNYAEKLEKVLEALEDAKDNSIYTEEDVEEIEKIIAAIEDLIYEDADMTLTEDVITEEEYEALKDDADEYLDLLEEVVEAEEVKALVEEVKEFIFANNFGTEIGEYSQNEAMSLLTLVFKYDQINDEDLEDYYKDLKLAFKKFKMSKLVAGEYLDTLMDYKDDLELLEDDALTASAIELRDDLIVTINSIDGKGKLTLGTFYEIEEQVLELLDISDVTDYEEKLNVLIEKVKDSFLASYAGVDQDLLRDEKMTLVGEYFVALAGRKAAEDLEDFEEVYSQLKKALDDFSEFLNQ